MLSACYVKKGYISRKNISVAQSHDQNISQGEMIIPLKVSITTQILMLQQKFF
jgi:hypothetical protein